MKVRNDSKKASRGTSKPVTIKTIVQYIMDIASASPRRYFFEVILLIYLTLKLETLQINFAQY